MAMQPAPKATTGVISGAYATWESAYDWTHPQIEPRLEVVQSKACRKSKLLFHWDPRPMLISKRQKRAAGKFRPKSSIRLETRPDCKRKLNSSYPTGVLSTK